MSIVNNNYTDVLKTHTKIWFLCLKTSSSSLQDMSVLRSHFGGLRNIKPGCFLGTEQLANICKYQSTEISSNSWKSLVFFANQTFIVCVCVCVSHPWPSHWFCIVKSLPGLISKALSLKYVTLQYGFYIIRNNSRWHMNNSLKSFVMCPKKHFFPNKPAAYVSN